MWFRNLLDSLKPAASRTPIQKARRGAPRRRPAPCRLAVEALEDRCVPASLSVSDVTLLEGNAGTQNAVVTVSLDAASKRTVTVNYSAADGTALAGGDYNAVSGKLTFARGETSKSILVAVIGDTRAEPNETFFVNLNGAKNATIADGHGVVTIVDDDWTQARLSINDASVWVGEFRNTFMTFTVSLAAAWDETVTVNFATQDGYDTGNGYPGAMAGADYATTSGTLTFAPGETTKTITVEIYGRYGTPEWNEWFVVNLSGASSNALIIDGEGIGWILDSYGSPPEPWWGGDSYSPASVSY